MYLIPFRQYLGTPITCKASYGDDGGVFKNNYCLAHSTFTVSHAPPTDVPHPGVGGAYQPSETKDVHYYQWVCFCLLLQVLLDGQCITNAPVGASSVVYLPCL